ncbi:PREDICTED: peroxidase [Prunus dulcis]|uniref:PREDICTED: peroxidase n=1 Tax=Prunus dulcis TaxID=3755 RepID=A0A5E4GGI1_PRUDU|nr:PREDICTED: peroxidase [Prunus dulcis]
MEQRARHQESFAHDLTPEKAINIASTTHGADQFLCRVTETFGLGPTAPSRTLQRGLGLLSTDLALMADERTKPLVDLYASNEKKKKKVFEDFAQSMIKVSLLMGSTMKAMEIALRVAEVDPRRQPLWPPLELKMMIMMMISVHPKTTTIIA